ncbi:MAG: 6-bladed beta-propeller [Bacteroidales bacterium]|jgi:hypothetical protein
MKKIVILFLFIFLISSCNPKGDNSDKDFRVIDIAGNIGSGRIVKLSEIADEIIYIPLETTENSLVGTPRNIYYSNGLIYIYSSKNHPVKIFNRDGVFIREFNRRGRGPEEYEDFVSMQVDDSTGNIYVESSNKINEYNPCGVFLKSVDKQKAFSAEHQLRLFAKMDNNLYIFSSKLGQNFANSYVAIDSLSTIKLTLPYTEDEKIFIKINARIDLFKTPYKFKDVVRIVASAGDYILSIDKNLNIDTSYIFNYGKYKITKDNISALSNSDELIFRSSDILESENFLFFQLHLGKQAHKPQELIANRGKGNIVKIPRTYALFNKKEGKLTFADQPHINQKGFADDLDGGPAFWPINISSTGYMLSFISAEDFICFSGKEGCTEKFKQIVSKLKVTDNPIVLMVKLNN